MTRLLAALSAVFVLVGAAPVLAAPVDTGHVRIELVADHLAISPGGTAQVALRQVIDKGWHTYWRNPGDAGEATRLAWTLPRGWTAGEIAWPRPERFLAGEGEAALMNYVYSGEVLLPVVVTAPADARPGQIVTLRAAASFLVCADICVPEDGQVELTLPVVAGAPAADPAWGPAIGKALASVPRPAGLDAAYQISGDRLTLAVAGAPLAGGDLSQAYFFPFSATVIAMAKPQTIERGPRGLTLSLPPGYDFKQGSPPTRLDGVLSLGDRAYEVSAAKGPAVAGAAGLGPPADVSGRKAPGGLGLLGAVIFAVLGGLILNLMPCVFPVLAMKAASLAGHAHERAAARAQGLAFLGGVLATFLALAGALIAVRAGGAAVGWGFQLQSPPVVAVLSILMLAVALNLSGLFEVGAGLQGAGSSLASRQGLAGAAFTGALAVVVAAPCTAPFMAPALGWALTQEPPAALAVFAGLGLGFAAPFTLAAFAPALLARLPRPGPWMETFRRLMAFPMYGAAAWLAWVLSVQAGSTGLARLLAAAVVLALAAWLGGRAQRRRLAGQGGLASGLLAGLLALAAAVAVIWPPYASATTGAGVRVAGIPEEPWSPQRVDELRAQGRPVFVNFTAAWCVTCQVNEKVAFAGKEAAQAFARTHTAYLKGDWTRKDPAIEAELARHGRAGVPLYLVYSARGGEPKVLPQVLTPSLLKRAVETAAE